MKLKLALALSLLTLPAFGADMEVTISTFRAIGDVRHRPVVAELCGTVKNAPQGHAHLTATVDYNGTNPGSYSFLSGKDGHFCQAVITEDGTVQVDAWQ